MVQTIIVWVAAAVAAADAVIVAAVITVVAGVVTTMNVATHGHCWRVQPTLPFNPVRRKLAIDFVV